ncbi:MAG: hypothetical protein K2K81_05350 [Muribaculaceae bacterium]|nr:hypothetical protein [Muribaculaceae bacterium]
MAKFTKRIPFDSIPVFDLSDSGAPDTPGIDPAIPSLPVISPSFSFMKSSLSGSGTTLPVADIDFSFPAEDQKRVQAWFTGDFSHVTIPESATLKRNMTTAVLSTLNSFINSATNRNLFTSPFRIGCRYRLFDNSCLYINEPLTLLPSEMAPLLIITSYKVYEKSIHTEVSISHSPSILMFAIPSPENAQEYRDIITSVEFFITRQSDLYSSDAKVSGIRSISADGIRQRVWHYESYETDALIAQAKAETSFRIISSLPFSEIADGLYSEPSPLPIEAGALQRLTSLQKITYPFSNSTGNGASGGSAGTSGASSAPTLGIPGWRPYLHISTSPLDLGLPEASKSISDLFLRGIFQRDEVTMTLYASYHREHWRMIARSHGPYIRGLRRAPYRWFKVEIQLPMRRDDFLEALTFTYAK